jgi:rhomboid family protein
MAGSRCSQCGREEFLPFRCKLCDQPHCLEHRLPENHQCTGLGGYRARAREDRAIALPRGGERIEGVEVKVRRPSPTVEGIRRGTHWFNRSMTHRLLGVLLAVYALQWAGAITVATVQGLPILPGGGVPLLRTGMGQVVCTFGVGSCTGASGLLSIVERPWSPLTAVFLHSANPLHIIFNLIFLYFFGIALEQRVGSRRLLGLFIVAGVLSSIAQVALFGDVALGASGALMGILGTLTVLSPTMQVLFYFVPLPLWILTVLFVALDISGLFGAPSGVANLAHLAGLAAGLAYGWRLRRRGVLPRVQTTWAFQRRG